MTTQRNKVYAVTVITAVAQQLGVYPRKGPKCDIGFKRPALFARGLEALLRGRRIGRASRG